MKDPVVDPEGNSYDREAILSWLEKNSTSPITRNPLRAEDLVPNRALKETMDLILNGKADTGNLDANLQASHNASQGGKSSKMVEEQGSGVHIDVELIGSGSNTLVSVKPNDKLQGINRTPSTVCCVIDISGSMADEAKIQNEAGKNEGFGLSILDLVKHAVRTIISSLGDNDRLSLVTFSTQAKVALQLTKMNEAGRKKAEQALEKMQPEESTNIWDGLYKGLEVLREGAAGRNSAILLLTDGQPNIVPPRGHLPMLQKYKDEHGLPNIINTFGFGYNLDSKLLHELAVAGNGAYAFIPDGSFVGTIFVNALSNLLATVANDVCLSIELEKPENTDFSLIKHYSHQITSWGLEMQLGSVMFGQAKNIVLPMTIDPSKKLNVTLKYHTSYESKPVSVTQELEVQQKNAPEIDMHRLRLSFVNEVSKAQELAANGSLNEALTLVKQFANEIKNSKVHDAKFMKDLLEDVQGQIVMALSKQDNFKKWGRHFLPSLIRAHLLQQCNNFKDPGVQNYGGDIFNKIRDKIDDIFVKIPPPKPSVKKAHPVAPVKNMAVFYNAHGGCIAGDCIATMADGKTKLVQDIKKGDEVLGANGEPAKVVCVVKTVCENNKARLVELESGLKITPWHPIRLGGKFFFPCTVEEPFQYEFSECPAVYNFVLESNHMMVVNGVECVTLAHGFQEDVVRHEYYGTSAVTDDLKRIEGWEDGLVVLTSGDIKRDANTGMVAGVIKAKEQSGAVSGSVALVV